MEMNNKTVLITGSTDGLGKALAQALVRLGAHVIIHGRDQDKVTRVVRETGAASGIVCDFTQPETIKASLANIPALDILINNAGVWLEGATTDASPEKVLELTNVNLASYLLVTKEMLPLLKKSTFGQVLNAASIAGVEIPQEYFHTIYSATKFGVQGFTEGLAKEYFNTNVRIMGYYPGGMETELFNKAGLEYKKHEPWMFAVQESVDAIIFMLTRNPKVSIKRMDLVNQTLG